MALPFAAQLAISSAPSLINLGANLLGGDRETEYQQELSSMADLFKEQASAPVTENRAFKSGKQQLDRADERRRDRIEESSAATGSTNEADLAATGEANEVYSDSLNQLMGRARQYRDQMRTRYLNTLGAEQKADRAADQRFARKVNQITKPFGAASRAFLMSDMFGSEQDESGGGDKTDSGTDQYDLRESHQNLFGN